MKFEAEFERRTRLTWEADWCCCAAGLNGAAALFSVDVLPKLMEWVGADCRDKFRPVAGCVPKPCTEYWLVAVTCCMTP